MEREKAEAESGGRQSAQGARLPPLPRLAVGTTTNRVARSHSVSVCTILFSFVLSWDFVLLPAMQQRRAQIKRATTETRIAVKLNLDGSGRGSIRTGIAFFDHMLTLFAKHAVMDLDLICQGDLAVDAHHSVEDCGLALGLAFRKALGNKQGLRRYGTGFDPRNPFTGEAYVPMDETLARCVVDFSGRACLVWRGLDRLAFKVTRAEQIQDMSSAFRFGLAREFFQGFANAATCTLHLELLYGQEPHHVVEALFKAFAKAVDCACQRDPRRARAVPSTKGTL